MGIEHEPRFKRAHETFDGETTQSQPRPPENPSKKETAVLTQSSNDTKNLPAKHPEAESDTITFDMLPGLVGKEILFRDPDTTDASDDPLYKVGKIEQQRGDGNLEIVIDKSKYYPYYTGYQRPYYYLVDEPSKVTKYDMKLIQE